MTTIGSIGGAPAGARVPSPTVGDVMRPPVTTVELRAHLAAAAFLMKRSGDTALVVTKHDETGVPLGIITDADISQAVADSRDLERVRISDLLSGPPIAVAPDTTIDRALRLMVRGRMHHLLVVAHGELQGVVDMLDLCRALMDGDPADDSTIAASGNA